MAHEPSDLYLEIQNEKRKWEHSVDGRLVGERLDLLFNVFTKSTGWPHDKIWFNAADMPIEARHKPSEVLSTIGNWYAVLAEFDCGINGVKKPSSRFMPEAIKATSIGSSSIKS